MNEQLWLNNVKVDGEFPSGKIVKKDGKNIFFKLDINGDVYIVNQKDLLDACPKASSKSSNEDSIFHLKPCGVNRVAYDSSHTDNYSNRLNPFLIIRVPIITNGVDFIPETVYYARNRAINYYQFIYIGDSRIDGYAIFKVSPTEPDGTDRGVGECGDITIKDTIDTAVLYDFAIAGEVVATFNGNAELVKALEDNIQNYNIVQ